MKTITNETGGEVGQVVHCFERAGLGQAPFRFVALNVNKYQACAGAPIQPGGSCDYCGAAIMYECVIKSKDGKTFKVGSDCVLKTDDMGLRQIVEFKVRDAKRKANNERTDARIAKASESLLLAAEALKKEKHSQAWRADQGQTRYDEVVWYLSNAGRSGKLWAARMIEQASK